MLQVPPLAGPRFFESVSFTNARKTPSSLAKIVSNLLGGGETAVAMDKLPGGSQKDRIQYTCIILDFTGRARRCALKWSDH